MNRLLFEKRGDAVYLSHLDLMRVFQRAFKRADILIWHSQGFSPRAYVSIALPLSVGIESSCELLDFDLDGEPIAEAEIKRRLNEKLVEGVRVLDVYTGGQKIKYLALLDCCLTLQYDGGVPEGAAEKITALLSREEVTVTKKSKSGNTEQNIIPMIRKAAVRETNQNTLTVQARICCQNPSLNPMQIVFAIEKYLPECTPSFVECSRMEIYDQKEQQFR